MLATDDEFESVMFPSPEEPAATGTVTVRISQFWVKPGLVIGRSTL